jgi:hypothetical protein
VASNLNGEIPATFPTVPAQVDAVPDAIGSTVTVALVSGGANDIGFTNVIDPRQFPGAFIEECDGQIRRVAYDDVLSLLAKVRRKCPDAVIMLFGYYRPSSYATPRSRIKDYFQYEANQGVLWYLNEFINVIPVDAMVFEARVRSEWAAGRAQYWMRQAVSDANAEDTLRGRGVIFVPARFDPENSVFAARPFVLDDYTHKTSDPAQAERERQIPRIKQLDELRQLHSDLSGGVSPTAAVWFVVAGSVRGERGLGAVDARSTRPAPSLGQSVAARRCGSAAGALRARSASPARPRRSPQLPPLPIAIDGGGLVAEYRQECVRQQRQGDVPIPGGPAADLVVVQADFAFGLLEGLLDRPAHPGDADQFHQRRRRRRKAGIEGQILGIVDRAASQQPEADVAGPAVAN